MMIARAAILFLFAVAGWGQISLPEDILRLARIKNAMRRHLDGMPNYTCLQTVERYHRPPRARREELVDILRLEVAFVEGRELYAWPGSSHFDDRELRDLVSSGAFSTGAFALHARALFLGEGAQFTFRGEEVFAGKAAWRYDYETPQRRSGYQIRNPVRRITANVAYRGSFWAEKATNNLIRLTIQTDEIPLVIELERASDQLDYQIVPIGSIQALLPRQSELHIVDLKGNESINRLRLTRCKQYATESSISFGDPEEVLARGDKIERPVVLPRGLELELALSAEIDHENSAVGDPIQATLRRDLHQGKELLAAKGSIAKGRIVRLEHSTDDYSVYNITLLFEELAGDGWRAPLKLNLLRLDPQPRLPLDATARARTSRPILVPVTGPNGFLIFASKLKLSRGFTTIWQTQ